MNDNELRNEANSALKFSRICLVVLGTAELCVLIYGIKSLVDYKTAQTIKGVVICLVLTGIITFLAVMEIVRNTIPLGKDVKFYNNNDVEYLRAVVVKVKWMRNTCYETTVRNLETGELCVFDFTKNIGKEKIYDIIYLKHSKINKISCVLDEQLTEENRIKASKIDFNQKD